MSSPGTIIISTCTQDFAKEELRGMCPPAHAVSGRYACIEVVDTGCGMSEETRQHLFDAFYTTKMCGHGLGLAVVLGIVRSHGGLVGVVASTPGKGTTFRVLLPCAVQANHVAQDAAMAATEIGGGTQPFRPEEQGLEPAR
jgi:two-component system, cell cycle sensor histidine kinase and response regulator CckA